MPFRSCRALASLLCATSLLHGQSPATNAAEAPAPQPQTWWAYRPLQQPSVPTAGAGWAKNPIDHFVFARLTEVGLQPAPAADPRTLARRLHYDLTGLPPEPALVEAFAADPSEAAYTALVEQLLASPHYGEHQARHWLDLVRYAETDGYERDRQKPFVWRYRDWVVDACNEDLPYGEFVRRQLAGDEREHPTVADQIATGFYRLGVWDDEPTDALQTRYDDLDSIADTTARVVCGVSLGCARCHDHKKDPLPQRDYYAFLAFFENLTPYDLRAHDLPQDGAAVAHERALREFTEQRAALRTRLCERLAAAPASPDPAAARGPGVLAHFDCELPSPHELVAEGGAAKGTTVGQVVACEGVHGQALRCDGDDAVLLPRLVAESFSVAFWVRSTHRGAGAPNETAWYTGSGLVDGEMPGVVADWGIAWHDAGRIVAGTGAPDVFVASAPGHHDGQWHHVLFTRDQASGQFALYVDGSLAGSATGGKRRLVAPAQLAVGRLLGGGGGFRGDLDELTFYDRALGAAEAAVLAQNAPGGLGALAQLRAAGGELAAACEQDALALAALRRPELATIPVLAVREAGARGPQGYVRLRGNVHSRGAAVAPGFPAMLGGGEPVVVPPRHGRSSGRRTALAAWLTDPAHLTTWRVVANRLWQWHFGRGLVRSSNDFGRLGDLPTHPELLDWLAGEVLARGQSLKAMHRLIVASATYRMASGPQPDALALDPQNDRFWRFDRRRLASEEVRDSILWAAGLLSLQRGGESVFPPLPAAVLATASRPEDAWGSSPEAQWYRRSLYVHQKRSLQEPLLAAFDQADTDASCPVRFATVQATQALTLWNGEFAQAAAARLALRLRGETDSLRAALARGLELTTQRPARADDVERLLKLAARLQGEFGRDEAAALQRCCLVLLSGNEFLFLD